MNVEESSNVDLQWLSAERYELKIVGHDCIFDFAKGDQWMRLNHSTEQDVIGLHFDEELIVLLKRPDGCYEFEGVAILTVHWEKVNFGFVVNKNTEIWKIEFNVISQKIYNT